MHMKRPTCRRSIRLQEIFEELSQKVLHIQIFVIPLRCTNTIGHCHSKTLTWQPAYKKEKMAGKAHKEQ